MRISQLIFLFALIFLAASDCVDQNCNLCYLSGICYQCNAGFVLSESDYVCNPDYLNQNLWGTTCSVGRRQSPINIVTSSIYLCPAQKQFYHFYSNEKTTIAPSGQNLKTSYVNQTRVEYVSSEQVERYKSAQFHWHHPSEHKINNHGFDLQLHIVHSNVKNSSDLAVTGLLFEIDEHLTTDFFDQIDFLNEHQPQPFIFPFDVKNRMVYHYQGSLTTPPCSQTVEWFVYAEPIPITQRNFNRISQAVNQKKSNARSPQLVNERKVQLMGSFCNNYPN